jgi:hypothetical protein
VKGLTLKPSILTARNQYRACHVRLPGEDQRVAAIAVDGKYYSLFKVVKDRAKALELCDRLAARGSQTLITQIAKGDAIWIWETDAVPASPNKIEARKRPAAPQATTRILESRHQYQTCYICVPDLDMRLAAVSVDGKYYALFKLVESREKAVELSSKLLRGGDEIVITKVEQGYAVWVLEVDAYLYLEK